MASDTIIGESLALSPYQELLKENEALRALLSSMRNRDGVWEWRERIDAAIAGERKP